jgi:hypothetical protein
MNRHMPAVVAALITSAVIFCAGFVYEGHRVRAVVMTKLDAMAEEVKALTERVRELERAKK